MDRQVPDSAGTATAILSGKKTNWYMVGQNANTMKDDCEGSKGNEVDTMLDWSKEAGMLLRTLIYLIWCFTPLDTSKVMSGQSVIRDALLPRGRLPVL